jgi:hypothetical protein
MEAEIAAELGGNLSAADTLLLRRGVELLTKRSKNPTLAVRAVNAGARVIARLRSKYPAIPRRRPTLQELGFK